MRFLYLPYLPSYSKVNQVTLTYSPKVTYLMCFIENPFINSIEMTVSIKHDISGGQKKTRRTLDDYRLKTISAINIIFHTCTLRFFLFQYITSYDFVYFH